MKLIHQISNNWTKEQVNELAKFNIQVVNGFSVFNLEEGEKYRIIKALLEKWGALDWLGTEFSKREVNEATYTAINSNWINDYPQPSDSYEEACYDLTNYCRKCGIGKQQKNDFRILKEPLWKTKKTFQLTWIYDELFVEKEYYNSVFKPLGIECRKVIIHKKDVESQNTVQLIIPKTDVTLNIDGYYFEDCPECRRRKFHSITQGFFPSFKKVVDFNIFKSQEYFGSGSAADNRLFVSLELKLELLKNKFNIYHYPVQS